MNSKRNKAMWGIFSLAGAIWSAIAYFILHILIAWVLESYLYIASQGTLYIFTGLILLLFELAVVGGFYYIIKVLERFVVYAPLETSPKSMVFLATYIIPIVAYIWLFIGIEEPLFGLGVLALSAAVRIVLDLLYQKWQKKRAIR